MVKKPATPSEFCLLGDQDRAAMRALVDTVSFPPPYPQVGDLKLSEGKKALEIQLVSLPYRVAQFSVPVEDIRGIYLATEPLQRFERSNLYTDSPLDALDKGATGIVFVRRYARVFMSLSFADTAAAILDNYNVSWGTCDCCCHG